LRLLLGREKAVGVYGTTGLIHAVEHKLRAYSWNLLDGYEGKLVFHVTETDIGGVFQPHPVQARRGPNEAKR
jgi:ribonuclease Z